MARTDFGPICTQAIARDARLRGVIHADDVRRIPVGSLAEGAVGRASL